MVLLGGKKTRGGKIMSVLLKHGYTKKVREEEKAKERETGEIKWRGRERKRYVNKEIESGYS